MLRYETETRPGLGALYDIRPGNRAGPFLQPRSPHGADITGAKDDGGGDDNTRCAKLQSNRHQHQTNTQLFAGRMMPFQPTASEHSENVTFQAHHPPSLCRPLKAT